MLIDREEALKWTKPEDWNTPDERWRAESEYGRYIQSLPTVEPQIIHCKDCKHFQIDGNFMFCNSEGSMFADVTESDFCSYAERRTE